MMKVLLKALLPVLPLTAYGHHPMGGLTPESILQGFLSGLGHPIIELDHLLFIMGFAWLLAVCSRHIAPQIALFLTLGVLGTVGRLTFTDIVFFEAAVFITTAVVGVLLVTQRLDHAWFLWILAPLAGLVHGYGYGGAIVGAESTPILAYLIGVSVVQAALMLGTVFGVRRLAGIYPMIGSSLYRSVSGAALIGLAFFV